MILWLDLVLIPAGVAFALLVPWTYAEFVGLMLAGWGSWGLVFRAIKRRESNRPGAGTVDRLGSGG